VIYVYIRGRDARAAWNEAGAVRPDAIAGEAFLRSIGATATSAEWVQETDLKSPSRLVDRVQGKGLLAALAPGDTVIFPELGGAFDFASDALAVIQAATGRNVTVYVLDLSAQPVVTMLPALQAIEAAFSPLEKALAEARVELAQVQAKAEARYQQALSLAAQELSRRWGPPASVSLGLPELGDVKEQPTNGHASTGSLIKAKREALGWSQRKLAAALGVTQPTVARIETDEAGADIIAAAFEKVFAASAASAAGRTAA
jgi:DNA-binding XRE family transcriptional regulator